MGHEQGWLPQYAWVDNTLPAYSVVVGRECGGSGMIKCREGELKGGQGREVVPEVGDWTKVAVPIMTHQNGSTQANHHLGWMRLLRNPSETRPT